MAKKYKLSSSMSDFVRQCEQFFPEEIIAKGVHAQRSAYNAMTASFARKRPGTVFIEDKYFNNVKVRCYEPQQNNNESVAILFAHGGGWYLGGVDSHDCFCADIAFDCGLMVVAVDYRLAPESPYPAALNDVYDAYQALLQKDITPLLIGDSAGGNLMAALALRCRDEKIKKACGKILIYPALAPFYSLPSHQLFDDAPLLSRESIEFCLKNYISADIFESEDEKLFPLLAKSFKSLPPTVVLGAEYDPLIDDARCYCQQLKQDGTESSFIQIKKLVHGALHSIGLTKEADELYSVIIKQVKHFFTCC